MVRIYVSGRSTAGVSGSGTDNTIPLWNGTTALDDSAISQDASDLNIANRTFKIKDGSGILRTKISTGECLFYSTSGANAHGFQYNSSSRLSNYLDGTVRGYFESVTGAWRLVPATGSTFNIHTSTTGASSINDITLGSANARSAGKLIVIYNASTEILAVNNSNDNITIGGGTTNNSAKLQIDSTSKGFLPPRMTTTEKNAISTPATGLIVFDTTLAKLCVYTGSAWETITSA